MRRRAALLTVLLLLAIASGVFALFMGGPYVWVHLAADGAALILIVYFIESTRRKREREAKVRPLTRRSRAGAELHATIERTPGHRLSGAGKRSLTG